MASYSDIPRDVLCKILSDKEMPADTKMELETYMGEKLFKPLELSTEFKEKLNRIFANRVPKEVPNHSYPHFPPHLYDYQLYKLHSADGNISLEVYQTCCRESIYYILSTPRRKMTYQAIPHKGYNVTKRR